MRWHSAAWTGLWALAAAQEFDYVVVGSGAGGGPLASRLARAGYSTLLIEAGEDQGHNANYSVPGYQARVTEDPKLAWDFYVSHYDDPARAQRDPKFVYDVDGGRAQYVGLSPPAGARPKGILYPRAAALGGCGAHNALIYIEAHDSDWDRVARLTGDASWGARAMDVYRDRVREWLPVAPTDPTILVDDLQTAQHVVAGATVAGHALLGLHLLQPLTGMLHTLLADPNARAPHRDAAQGLFQTPLTMRDGRRVGVRDLLVDTVDQGHPLTIWPRTLVTRVAFDTSGPAPRATGVDYRAGAHLYSASPLHTRAPGTPGHVEARREVILAAGAFNTPQLLQLSGVGPADDLARVGIPLVHDAPGVGRNLQDRYEIPVSARHERAFHLLDGCTFDQSLADQCYQRWADNPAVLAQKGPYASDGLAATLIRRSAFADDNSTDADLFLFGGPVDFTGYFPGWSLDVVADHRYWSWYALKAHTRNRAGSVSLRSADPTDQPDIRFRYFDEGTADERDAESLVEAIQIAREALATYHDFDLLGGSDFAEVRPGQDRTAREDLLAYVKDVAWGHHASCSARIGGDGDDMAVLDSRFRVRGVRGLRVVDASVFPEIPGSFLQSPIFVVSEKAADVIIQDAQSTA